MSFGDMPLDLARRILADCDGNVSKALFKTEAESRHDRTGLYRMAAQELRRMLRGEAPEERWAGEERT